MSKEDKKESYNPQRQIHYTEVKSMNHLMLNDIEPELLRILVIELFDRVTQLEHKTQQLEWGRRP